MSNKAVRTLAKEAGEGMHALAEKLGVTLTATYVPITNHKMFVAVEADSIDAVRELAFQGRLAQWNTVEIYPCSTLEEATVRTSELPTLY